MIKLKYLNLVCSREDLSRIPNGKVLINTINAFSYNNALKDEAFQEALLKGDYLIPDGASIVKACRWLNAKSQPKERIAGWDLFEFEMKKLHTSQTLQTSLLREASDKPVVMLTEPANEPIHKPTVMLTEGRVSASPRENENEFSSPLDSHEPSWEPIHKPTVMFMGSSEKVLGLIKQRAAEVYPGLEIVTYSPPYKPEFSDEDNKAIIEAINEANPDLLWIGMTAPKQEKWTYTHWDELNIHCHVGTIGAVFDFFAGTYQRAPLWWQEHSLEWLYRLMKEPKRMWRRYIIGNTVFLWNVLKEKML